MHNKGYILSISLLLAIIAFYAISFLYPAYWNWSVFALPGLTTIQLAILGLVLFLLFIPPISSLVYRKFSAFLEILSTGLGKLPMIAKLLLWIVIPFVLLYFFRFNTHIYGDSQNLIGSIVSGEISSPFYNRIGMLMQLLATPLNLVNNTREAASNYLAIISIMSGIVFMFFTWKTIRLLIESRGSAVISYLAIISSGLIIIFAGYIEVYSIIIAWLSVYIYCSLRYINGQFKTSHLILVFLIGMFWHLWFIAFLPSLIYILNRRLKFMNRKIMFAAGFIFGIGLYFAGQAVHRGDFPLTISFLPNSQSNYWLFSPAHLLNMANQLVIIGPILAVMGLVLAIFHKKEDLDVSNRFLLWTGLPALAIAFMIDPHLGAARDWDLFSIFAVPLSILGVLLLLKSRQPILKYALTAVLLFNILHTGSILAVNKKQDYAVDRIIDITYNDPHYLTGYYGGERNTAFAVILANGYHRYGDAIRFLQRMVDANSATENDLALMANYCFLEGRYKEAAMYFDQVKDEVRFYSKERLSYGYSLYSVGDYSRAIEQLRYVLRDTCVSGAALFTASSFAYYDQIDSCKKYCEISIRCAKDSIHAMHNIIKYLPELVYPQLKAQYASRALAVYPDSLEIRNSLINLFKQAGMPDSADFYENYRP